MDIYTDKIKVELTAVIGSVVVPFSAFVKLQCGSVLKLNRNNDCMVAVTAGNKTIANGVISRRNNRLEVEIKEKL